jgi:hypothetical protein
MYTNTLDRNLIISHKFSKARNNTLANFKNSSPCEESTFDSRTSLHIEQIKVCQYIVVGQCSVHGISSYIINNAIIPHLTILYIA